MKTVVSIDFGGVIAEKMRGSTSPDLIPQMPEVSGALDGVRKLVRTFGPEGVWIVSRASDEARPRILDWLERHGVIGPEFDAVPHRQVRFCYERAQKAGILSEIGASAHVDDQHEVFYAPGAPQRMLRFLFRVSREALHDGRLSAVPRLFLVTEWPELIRTLEYEVPLTC